MRVLAPGEEPATLGTLTVTVHHETGELVMDYRRPSGETLTRRVPLPEDAAAVLRIAAFLAENMVRDESRNLLRDLSGDAAPPAAPDRESAAEPAPPEPRAPPAPARVEPRRFWIGIGAEAALTITPAAGDACASSSGYYCLMSTGQGYTSDATLPYPNSVTSGLVGAGARFAVSLDYAVTDNWLVGGRFGYSIGRYPGSTSDPQAKAWGPLHLEARASYVLGEQALARPGVRLALTIGAGVGEWDARVPLDSHLVVTGMPGTINPLPIQSVQSLDAWRVQAGPFLSLGAGPRFAFGDRFAILANVAKLTVLTSITASTGVSLLFTPELALEVGL
jgi:hypothetical protein